MSLIYQTSNLINGRRPGIYIGGKADAKNKDKLLARNVTHILNLTPPKEACIQAGVPNYFENSNTSRESFTYLRIPIYDASTSVTAFQEAADSMCNFIGTALCHGSILVHCQRGVSRSVAAVLLYLIRRVGMSLDEAMELIQRRRPEANPIPEFMAMLKDYELLQIRSAEGDDVKANNNKRTAAATSPSRPDDAPKRPKPIGPSRPVTIIGPDRPAPESLVGSHETTSYCNYNAVMIGPTTATTTEGPSESKNDFKEKERNAAQSSSSECSSPSTKRRRIKEDVKDIECEEFKTL